jgi:hypothetical protein
VALGHATAAPAASGSEKGNAAAATAQRSAAPPAGDAAEIRSLIAETNTLQGALATARKELTQVLSHPGGKTIIYKTVPVAGSAPASSGPPAAAVQSQLAAEQATLNAERAQLQQEQAQLGGEAHALAARQSQLATEAAALAAEAKRLAQKPTTHGGTGATGATGGTGSDGGHDT